MDKTLCQRVAEEVMGWTETHSYASAFPGDSELVTGIPPGASSHFRKSVPAYDTDWNAAMAVVDKFGQQPYAIKDLFLASLKREASKAIFKPHVDVYSIPEGDGSLLHDRWLWFYVKPVNICEAALWVNERIAKLPTLFPHAYGANLS